MSRSRKTKFNEKHRRVHRRITPDYPSVEPTSCNTFKTDDQKYTGTLVKGIVTMHKSNAVPVTKGFNSNPKLHNGGIE